MKTWKRAIPYIEIPQTAFIRFKGADNFVLDDGGPGTGVPFSGGTNTGTTDIFSYDAVAGRLGFESLILDATGIYHMNIEPGRYKIEVTF